MSGRLLIQTRDELQKLIAAVEVWEDEEGFNIYLLSDPQAVILLTVLRICRLSTQVLTRLVHAQFPLTA